MEGPKFVEACGIQLVCPYCRRKFKAPQGLVAHKHMHERAGDSIHPKKVLMVKRQISNPEKEVAADNKRNIKLPPTVVEKARKDVVLSKHTDSQSKVVGKPTQFMSRRFTIVEKLEIIDKYKTLKNISETCRQVQKRFSRFTFARKSLSVMLLKEEEFRNANGTKSLRKTVRGRSGLFHRMDNELGRQVRETRRLGIPVETYMLEIEGVRIMKEFYPKQFTEDGTCKFKFSSGQKRKQMERQGFSHRRITTKKKKNLSASEVISAITKFQLDTRVFQQTCSSLPETRVFNRDQVPMALAGSYASSIDEKNKDIIQDATYDSSDVKRFCTLNLTVPMKVEDDLSNLVRPHLVFKATRFVRGEDQNQKNEEGILERELWDKRVVVSFQENAWVDAQTNLYGLSKARLVYDQFPLSVQFEDNLSSHKTPAVNEF